MKKEWKWVVLYGAGCALTLFSPGLFAGLFGIVLPAIELFAWLRTIGREINLTGLLRVSVLLTMWLAPALAYGGAGRSWYTGHIMPVPEVVWWLFAAPGVMALNLALRWPWRISGAVAQWRLSPGFTAKFLIPIGLTAQLFLPFTPPAFQLAAHLGAQLVFVGILYAVKAWPAKRWWWVSGGSLYALMLALQTTIFGYSFLWMLMMLLVSVQGNTIHNVLRYGLPLIAGLALLILFSFKYEYRKTIQQSAQTPISTLNIFNSLLWEQVSHPGNWAQKETIETIINRLNQGYYTAQTMAWTPAKEPFARGETMLRNLWAIAAPRFIDPDKHRAGGKENMKRFAGVSGRTYSMNIGIFGEAYVNFGVAGGVICLFGYGLLLGGLIALTAQRLDFPWWPYLFLPALDVESDMGIVWNHIVKAGAIAILLVWLFRLFKTDK